MEEITIRPATEDDLPYLRGLIAELLQVLEQATGASINDATENCRALLMDPNSSVLVGVWNEMPIAFINFTTRRTICHPGPSGIIDELFVASGFRLGGLGRRLLEAAVAKCREMGCVEVEVSTELSNTRAREFYQRCGFDEDAVLLERDLDD